MTRRKLTITLIALTLVAVILVTQAPTIAARGGRGVQGGMRGGMGAQGGMRDGIGNFDRTAMMKNMLRIDDAKWPAIQPKLQKVTDLQRDLDSRGAFGRGAMMGGMMGRSTTERPTRPGGATTTTTRPTRPGGATTTRPTRPGATTERPQSAVAKAGDALRQTLGSATGTDADITAKLTALRAAKVNTKKQLVAAQKDLAASLTLRQQAQCVMMQILE